MTRAALLVSLRATLVALAALTVCVGALALISAVEPGAGPPWRALVLLLGPVALGGAAAATLAMEQRGGRWAGWESLGRDPRRLLLPLLAVVVAGGTLELAGVAPVSPLPSPVAPDIGAWWDPATGAWTEPPPASWATGPHELSLADLTRRGGQEVPPGARRGVDRGELVRRLGLAASWLLALLAAVRVRPLTRPTGASVLGRGARAAGAVLIWQVVVVLCAAWAAAP